MKKFSVFPFVLVIGFIGWFFLLSSCSSSKNTTVTNPPSLPSVDKEAASVGDSSRIVGETAKSVEDHAEVIDGHVSSIESKTPAEVKEFVKPDLSGIRQETKGLKEDSVKLYLVEQKLKEAEAGLEEQKTLIKKYTDFANNSELEKAKLKEKIKDLESAKQKLLNTLLAWISVACVVGIGASLVIGFFFKTPSAFMIAAGCVATLGVSVAVSLYMTQIAWISLSLLGVGFIAAIVYVALQIKNKDKAVGELIHTGEVAKAYLPTDAREKIFGNEVEPGVAHAIQSDSTIKIVRNVRSLDKNKRGYGLVPAITAKESQDPYKSHQDPYVESISLEKFSGDKTRTILG